MGTPRRKPITRLGNLRKQGGRVGLMEAFGKQVIIDLIINQVFYCLRSLLFRKVDVHVIGVKQAEAVERAEGFVAPGKSVCTFEAS